MAVFWNLLGVFNLEFDYGVGAYEALYLEEFYKEREALSRGSRGHICRLGCDLLMKGLKIYTISIEHGVGKRTNRWRI